MYATYATVNVDCQLWSIRGITCTTSSADVGEAIVDVWFWGQWRQIHEATLHESSVDWWCKQYTIYRRQPYHRRHFNFLSSAV